MEIDGAFYYSTGVRPRNGGWAVTSGQYTAEFGSAKRSANRADYDTQPGFYLAAAADANTFDERYYGVQVNDLWFFDSRGALPPQVFRGH